MITNNKSIKYHYHGFLSLINNGCILQHSNLFQQSIYHLILSNSPSLHFPLVKSLWNNCQYKICADGSANRLYKSFESNTEERSQYIPTHIVGDLDSLKPHISNYYK